MSNLSKMKNFDQSPEGFSGAIRTSWNKAIESVIATAKLVKQAEEQLDRRQLSELKRRLEQDRIMSSPTFSKLAKIASNAVLTAPENLPRLPTSYATLYELTHHDLNDVQDALDQGKLHAAIKNREILDVFPKRAPARLVSTSTKTAARKVSIRFVEDAEHIPDELLLRLSDILKEIEQYVDVQSKGLSS